MYFRYLVECSTSGYYGTVLLNIGQCLVANGGTGCTTEQAGHCVWLVSEDTAQTPECNAGLLFGAVVTWYWCVHANRGTVKCHFSSCCLSVSLCLLCFLSMSISLSVYLCLSACLSTSFSASLCLSLSRRSNRFEACCRRGLWTFTPRPSMLETVSLLALMTMQMVVLSHWLWMGHKRTTEDDKLLGSDHPWWPASGTAMERSVYTYLHYAWSGDHINKQTNKQTKQSLSTCLSLSISLPLCLSLSLWLSQSLTCVLSSMSACVCLSLSVCVSTSVFVSVHCCWDYRQSTFTAKGLDWICFICSCRMQSVQNLGLAVVTLVSGKIVDSNGYLILEVFYLMWLCCMYISTVLDSWLQCIMLVKKLTSFHLSLKGPRNLNWCFVLSIITELCCCYFQWHWQHQLHCILWMQLKVGISV